MNDEPVPWHVSVYVAMFSNPLVASMLLAVVVAPLGVFIGPRLFSLMPFPASGVNIPPTGYAFLTWTAATLTFWVHLTKPY